jgi:hypothetical protein
VSDSAVDKKIEIDLRLNLYEANWERFKAALPDKYIQHLEKYINDSGAAVASPEESESIIGVETNFELF